MGMKGAGLAVTKGAGGGVEETAALEATEG